MKTDSLMERAWGFKPLSRLANEILMREAFDIVRKETGKVAFKHSSITDPHIRELVDHASKKLGIPAAEIDAKLLKELASIEDFKKYSFVLYDTLAKNAVESAAFDLVAHAAENPEFADRRVVFDLPTFFKLIRIIELEHYEQFFPLRAPGETHYIYGMDPIIVPGNKDPKYKQFNGIPTACATARGDFVFNKVFMQQLLDFAVYEGLRAKGKKYASNGGPIPDAYSYIEFLIIHELLHYTYGDFASGKRLGQYSHKVHNWASDFRSNYMLVKNGYDQLPIGLFSDHINYDRQGSYDAMVKLVHDELEKLPKPLQDKFKELSDLDEHEPQKKPPQVPYKASPGEVVRLPDGSYGRVSRVDADGTFDVDAISKEQAAKILGYPPGTTVKENQQPRRARLMEGKFNPSDVTWMKPYQEPKDGEVDVPNQDEIQKDIGERMKKRKEIGSEEEAKEKEKQIDRGRPEKPQGPTSTGPGPGGMSDLASREEEIKNLKPKLPWKALLRKMLSSSITMVDTSYAKPARRSVTGITVAAATGAGAVKPGERTMEQKHNKIALVFDTSGSMWNSVPQSLAEARNLLEIMGKSCYPVAVIFFAGDARYFKVNLGDDTFVETSGVANMAEPLGKNAKKGWKTNLLGLAASGGTKFSKDLIADLSLLCNQGYNVMIFSDEDLLVGENWGMLRLLWEKNKAHVWYVANTLEVWREAVRRLGAEPPTWTHL